MDLQDKKHNVIIWLLTGLTVAGFLGYAVAKGQLHGVELFIIALSLAAVVGLLALADLGFFHTPPRSASGLNPVFADDLATRQPAIFAKTSAEPEIAAPAASPYLSSGKKRKKKRR